MATTQSQPWEFRQLGPPNRTLTLDGPNAPYGRPRKGAVVEEELELRASVTYYPGNDEPDRHVFGTKQTPITLTGRFMDSRIGRKGEAQAKWDEMSSFVKDQVMVHAQWGGIYAATGLLTKCKRGAESDAEFTWSLTLDVNTDDTKPILGPIPALVDAGDQVKQIADKVRRLNVFASSIPADVNYQPGFLQGIGTLLNKINSLATGYETTLLGIGQTNITSIQNILNTPSASLKTFAESVDNFTSAVSSNVAHFRAIVSQMQQSCDQLQVTLSSAENDPAIVAARGPSQNVWGLGRAEAEESLLEVMAIIAVLDLTAEIVQRGQPHKIVNSDQGQTWESLARIHLGTASKADDLRKANGAVGGGQPLTGQVIHIPKTT
jgi:hypothetical protein